MVSLRNNSVLAAAISVVIGVGAGVGVAGSAQATGMVATEAGGSAFLAATAADSHLELAEPLALLNGSVAGHPSLDSLTAITEGPQDTALLPPVGVVVAVGTQNGAATLELGFGSSQQMTATAEAAVLGGLTEPERTSASLDVGAATSSRTASEPEPTTYALMLMSLGIVGWLKLRGR